MLAPFIMFKSKHVSLAVDSFSNPATLCHLRLRAVFERDPFLEVSDSFLKGRVASAKTEMRRLVNHFKSTNQFLTVNKPSLYLGWRPSLLGSQLKDKPSPRSSTSICMWSLEGLEVVAEASVGPC